MSSTLLIFTVLEMSREGVDLGNVTSGCSKFYIYEKPSAPRANGEMKMRLGK